MDKAEPMSTPLSPHFKLSAKQCAETDEYFEYMSKVPYSSVVGSLMYVMVCSHPNLSMSLAFLVDTCLILERNIGRLFSGFSYIYVVLLVLVYGLVNLEIDWLAIPIQTMLVI
jgi:hypothetical protein